MKSVVAALCLGLVVVAGAPIQGQGKSKQAEKIPLALTDAASQSGYADPGDIDSTRDVQNQLGGCSLIRIVPEHLTAATSLSDVPKLFLSVSRSADKTDGAFPTYYEALHAMVMVRPATGFDANLKVVPTENPYVKLIYKVGGPGQWRYAAKQVVKDLCEWVKTNRVKLLDESASTTSVQHF